MGLVASCCKPSVITPDAGYKIFLRKNKYFEKQETRRRQQVEAAEKRRAEAEARGVKDPNKITRLQQRSEQMDKLEQTQQAAGAPALRWTAN